jgi:steroid delta-isomerase-like uncharacterized protein
MSAEQNMDIIRQAVQAVNSRNLGLVPQFMAPNFKRHDLAGVFEEVIGREEVADLLQMLLRGLPDVQLNIERIFGTDEYVAAYLTVVGTHQGEFLGVQPSGKQIVFNQINLYRFEDGKITETWQLADLASILQQIGRLDI